MGPYLTAFTKGYVFLLDECNLCPLFVIESIESSLDSGEYTPSQSTEDKTVYKMHKNFRLVITLNPNKDKSPQKEKNYLTGLSKDLILCYSILSKEQN